MTGLCDNDLGYEMCTQNSQNNKQWVKYQLKKRAMCKSCTLDWQICVHGLNIVLKSKSIAMDYNGGLVCVWWGQRFLVYSKPSSMRENMTTYTVRLMSTFSDDEVLQINTWLFFFPLLTQGALYYGLSKISGCCVNNIWLVCETVCISAYTKNSSGSGALSMWPRSH